jgi:acetylornithine/succinyldiaminopimelate/putrescine aminotransferase
VFLVICVCVCIFVCGPYLVVACYFVELYFVSLVLLNSHTFGIYRFVLCVTQGGNPLACAAGLAVAQYFSDHNVLANVRARGEQLRAGLTALAAKYPTILGPVRGWGLLVGVECIAKDMLPGVLVQAAMDQGLLLVAAGTNVVRWVPPLIISATEIDEGLAKFETAVASVASSV